MALNFPSGPTNGQTYTYGGITYYYDSSNISWLTTYVAPPTPPSTDFAAANNWANTKLSNVVAGGPVNITWSSTGGYTNATINISTSGVIATTYGGSTNIPVLTLDSYGRITSASNVTVQGMDYAFANTKIAAVTSNSNSRIWANTSIDGNNNENVFLDLSTSGVTATTYGGTTQIPSFTVDAYGRLTFAGNNAISSGGGSTIGDESSSASTFYPVFTTTTSGTMTSANVDTVDLNYVPSTGTLSAKVFNSLSDITLKTDIEGFDGVMLLDDINPVSFKWKNNSMKSYGVIAQELEKAFPDLVQTNEQGIKSVSYDPLIAILIDVVKKQQKDIEEIKKLLNRKNI